MTQFRNSIDIGVKGQRTLPAEAFLSSQIAADEHQRIFSKNWVCVARESDFTELGSFSLRQIGSESIIVVRDMQGVMRAHFNICRHRGTRLCETSKGSFHRTISCPYHAWNYGLDGQLVGVPDEKQLSGFSRADYPLHSAACVTWEGFVFVNLSHQPESFDSAFAPLQDRFTAWNLGSLVRLGQREYDVAANWKLIVQNYSECYHCAPVHPRLVKLSPPTSGGNDLVEGPFLGGYMELTSPGGSLSLSGKSCGVTLGSPTAKELQRVYYYVLFPNLFLSLHHDYVMLHTLWPIAPGQTRIECEWLFHPDTANSNKWNPNDAIDFWDQTNREDWHVSELTQLGVASSRYSPGPYSNREAMSAAFDREYLRRMHSSSDTN